MKFFFIIILILSALFCNIKGYSQGGNRDSLTIKSVNYLQKKITLSDSIAKIMLQLRFKENQQRDSLGKRNLSIGERSKELKNIEKNFRQEIKKILTSDQWNQYLEIESDTKARFIKYAKKRKLRIQEISDTGDK
jgi:hypothetical protein